MKYPWLILSFVLLSACGGSIVPASIPGKYAANHGKGSDVVEVFPDGTYSYLFIAKDGRKIENRGRWTFEMEEGKPTATFENFTFGLPGYGAGKPGFWVVTVERCRRKLCLNLDPDLGYYFIRQP